MKKLAKILLAVLVVMTLLGTLAFAVMADDTVTEEVTPWTPAEGSGITYAVWNTEADYLSGTVDPVISSTDTVWTTATTQSNDWKDKTKLTGNTAYVVFFANMTVSTDADVNLLTKDVTSITDITFNLNGNTLTQSASKQIITSTSETQNVTVTFVGGTLDVYKIRWRRGDNLIFDRVNLSATIMGHTTGANLTIKNSTCTFKGSNPFFLGPVKSGGTAKLEFINSDVTFTSASIYKKPGTAKDAYNAEGIFEIFYNEAYACDFDIIIDKDTVFKAATPGEYIFVCLSNAVTLPENYSVDVYIEEGAIFSGFSPFKNTWRLFDASSYGYSGEAPIVGDAEPSTINVQVVEPGTTANDDGYELKTYGNVMFFYDEDTIAPYDDTKIPEGTTFAVWESEAHYLTGEEPKDLYDITSFGYTFTKGFVGADYVRLYSDVTFTGGADTDYMLNHNVNLTIDLNNHLFNATAVLKVGGNTNTNVFTLKNGTVSASQTQFKVYHTFILDNITYNAGAIGYASGGNLIIRDSYVNLSNKNPFSLSGAGENGSEVRIENSHITVNCSGTSANSAFPDALFSILYNENSYQYLDYDIYIDADSRITTKNFNYPILGVNQSVAVKNGTHDLNLYVETGAVFANYSTDMELWYKSADSTALTADFLVVDPDTTDPATYEIKSFSNGDKLFYNESTFKKYTVPETLTYAAWASEEQYAIGMKPILTSESDKFESGIIFGLVNNAYVRLFQDVNYANTNQGYGLVDSNKNLTIDLGGKTLKSRTEPIPVSQEAYKASLRLQSGTIDMPYTHLGARRGTRIPKQATKLSNKFSQ